MMAGKVVSNGFRGLFLQRPYAAQASAAKKVEPSTSERISLTKQDVKTTTLSNGLLVASIENYSPISRIAVIVKAGPRFEPANQLGISHCLRNSAGLSTKKSTIFGVTRNIEKFGGSLHASCSRENIIYELSYNRDHLDHAFKFLAQTVTQPALHHWEVSDALPRMKIDVAVHDTDPVAVLMDNLHKVAFRGGLRNSLNSPKFMLGHHNNAMLEQYIEQTFGTGRAAVVGLGVDHAYLVEYSDKLFKFQSGKGSAQGTSKFKGGETFMDADLPVSYAAVVAEGAGLNNQKDVLCLALLQKILGNGPQVKYSNCTATKLGAAAAKATSHPFAVCGINVNYADTGLFGFCTAGHPEDLDKLVKGLVTEMRTLKNVTANDVSSAKQKLKASIGMSLESQEAQLEEMALHALTSGQLVTASDLEKAIDAVSAQDVTAVAAKVLKGKPAMAVLGQLQKTPCLEDLV